MTKPKAGLLAHLSKSLLRISKAMEYGAKKYGVEGVQKRTTHEYLDKSFRHLLQITRPAKFETEFLSPSDTRHATACAFNLLALVELYGTDEEQENLNQAKVNYKAYDFNQDEPETTHKPYPTQSWIRSGLTSPSRFVAD